MQYIFFSRLAKFVDKFGARPSGSDVLEQSIDYMIELTREEEINDITTEQLEVSIVLLFILRTTYNGHKANPINY